MNKISKKTMHLIFLKESWGHMTSVSGFDSFSLSCVANDQSIIKTIYPIKQTNKFNLFKRIVHASRVRINRGYHYYPSQYISPFCSSKNEEQAKYAVKKCAETKNSYLILTAGENQFGKCIVDASDDVKKRTIIVFHQPPSWLRLHWKNFTSLDGFKNIVCLSQSQKEFFDSITSTPSILIKHGVIHTYFKPPSEISNANKYKKLLFVGQWLRDFDTLESSMRIIWDYLPDVTLDCVIPRFSRSSPALMRLARDNRVRWHADISPDELLALYQSATLLYLPLIDAVANNAIVEALSCGLPVVSTNVGGIPEYIPPGAGELCRPNDPEDHAKTAIKWILDETLQKNSSHIGREFALKHLDWNIITKEFISDII
jgi:glycosyltransferase involved in cell wall biosynthesis